MRSVAVTALLMIVGLVGIVVPVLPGLLLVWLATGLWAFEHPNPLAWLVFGIAGLVYAAGVLVGYLVPGRRLKEAGVTTPTLVLAVACAVAGFVLVPVVGAVAGFVLGVFVVEWGRHRRREVAWRATRQAVLAVVTSVGVELATGFVIVVVWLAGVWWLGIPAVPAP